MNNEEEEETKEYVLKLNGYQINNLYEMLIRIANDLNGGDRQKYDTGDWFSEIAFKIRTLTNDENIVVEHSSRQ